MPKLPETLALFDAVRIVNLPEGKIPSCYSQTGITHIHVGDVGVVIAQWPGGKFRVEAVDKSGAILWQDHTFERDQLEKLPPTDATYCRRRINEHWAWQLSLTDELLQTQQRKDALDFACKVMSFARQNLEVLFARLTESGYQFAHRNPFCPPEENVKRNLEELWKRGVYVPVSLQAWLIEVGCVDFCGTHPDWPRTGCAGIYDDQSDETEPWYTDPLVIDVSTKTMLEDLEEYPPPKEGDFFSNCIEIAPDDTTKANISGGGPISISSAAPRFDNVLVGQHGSLTLLSYLRHAFSWGGFPGFDYITNAPTEMIHRLTHDLTRL